MNTRPLPRSAGRAPVVALAAVVVLLATPSVLVPGLTGDAPTPLWVSACGLSAQVALFALHVRLFAAHRRGTHLGVVLDGLTSWACFTAALLMLALEPLGRLTGQGEVATATSLVCLAGGFAGLGVAVVSGTVVGWEQDRRLGWAAGAALLSVPVVLHEVLPSSAAALGGAGGSAVLALLCLAAFTGLVLTPAPQRTAPVPARWRDRVGYTHAVGSLALVVVGVQALVPGDPRPEVVAPALLALALVGLRVAVLSGLVGSLQGSHEVALTDDLTGLGNRRALLSRLGEALRHDGGVALLVLDLDRFKHVNDGLGHQAGDQLLRQVADVLRTAVEGRTLLARLGGDEFAVLLLEVDDEHAEAVAWRIHTALGRPFQVAGRSVHAPASVGLAVARGGADPSAGGSALDLLRRADTAMYAAKAAKAGPVSHDLRLDRAARETLQTGEELRRAFDRGELLLHFQPQVDVTSGSLRGVEALVRWNHPERGLLAPDTFVRVAEELGLIGRLTEVVLEAAVLQAAAWHREGAAVPVSVNLSAADVGPALVPTVSSLLVGSGLPPRLLVLEITETTLVVDPEGVAAVLRDLVELGVEISIDDFGTGYSSLTLLLQLPVAEVKIDRSFVAALGRDAGSGTVVRTTVDLAHSLGMRVVAEGVEDDEVLAHLEGLGCDISQGFLHSRPLPAADATDWILARQQGSPTLPV